MCVYVCMCVHARSLTRTHTYITHLSDISYVPLQPLIYYTDKHAPGHITVYFIFLYGTSQNMFPPFCSWNTTNLLPHLMWHSASAHWESSRWKMTQLCHGSDVILYPWLGTRKSRVWANVWLIFSWMWRPVQSV